MSAYYNEIDLYCVQWLKNLIKAGLIAPGEVDNRDIKEVCAADLKGFTQCHFFAGIGIWSLALRRAGISDSQQVWTGSCPCQPFSTIGSKKGLNDDRHLFPTWFELIQQIKPKLIFGEQVSSADGLTWFDVVQDNLESANYATGALDLCSASIGAPNVRQRLYFFASRLENATSFRCKTGSHWQLKEIEKRPEDISFNTAGDYDYSKLLWIRCADNRKRPLKPGIHCLAYGDTFKLARLRAIGNAINAHVATYFIKSVLEVLP